MPEELRVAFHRDLQTIEDKVQQLFALVAEGLAQATEALLAGDREAARELTRRELVIEGIYRELEELIAHQFALQSPMARDLRFLLSVLRVVPELERSHDLAEHVAKAATRGLTPSLTPRVRGLIEEMGRVAVEMWHASAEAFATRNVEAADRLDDADDELDELQVSMTAEVVSGKLDVPVAVELALIARFYERAGDHAVNVARRVRFLASGQFTR